LIKDTYDGALTSVRTSGDLTCEFLITTYLH